MTPNQYNDSEITALIAYVRNIGSVSLGDSVLGDADNGQLLYEGVGECATCHRIDGRGPRFAPDLSSVGAKRTAGSLERALLGGSDATLPINRPVRIVTAEGQVVVGRRLNEDTFTVQIVNTAEQLLSLDKRTLREYTVLDVPEMPSYRDRLSEPERADVVAYLLTLKGTK
jgi:putative heme-binding domain-containing protein